MPIIGAHISAAGSLDLSLKRAQKIGAKATQIFITPPQQWAQTIHSEETITRYKETQAQTGIGPNFIHGVYLINLASANPYLSEKSTNWLIYSQNLASELGIEGTIFHIGSTKGQDKEAAISQVISAIKKILNQTGSAHLILENPAGAGELVGDRLSELGQIIKEVGDSRVKVCLDTQHAFASGYELRTAEAVDKFAQEVILEIGLENLIAIHANDSKTEFSSHRDRHENIGEGLIGVEGFKYIINHPAFTNAPFILEVPGFESTGPDIKNIQLLQSLIQ